MKKQLTVGSLKHNEKIENTKTKLVTSEKNNNIEVVQKNQTFSIKPKTGEMLLDAALDQGMSLDYKCKKGTCGKCTVKLISGDTCLSKPSQQEVVTLKENIDIGYRLACQSEITCS